MPEKVLHTRPWTEHHVSPAKLYRQQKADIRTPVINTYAKQLQQCNRLYDKVTEEFRKSDEKLPKIETSKSFSYYHQRPSFTKSAPGTFYFDDPYEIQRLEWSLTSQFREKRHHTEYMNYSRHHHQDYADDSRSISVYSDNYEIDPFQLSDILHKRGFRKPVLVCYDKNGVEIRKTKPRIIRPNNGALPKNPSVREKIKGRARLDYEMANMRAAAFCEQQAQRKFRTASADMRNRDLELVEEDFLERINKQDNNDNNNNDDDTGSIIMSMDKDELFQRIDKWIDDVSIALGESSHSTSKIELQSCE